MIDPMFWLAFPFLCVLIPFVIVGVARFIKWLKFRHEWINVVRTQRTQWEQEEIELLRGVPDEDDRQW